jgi:hypothetical protein
MLQQEPKGTLPTLYMSLWEINVPLAHTHTLATHTRAGKGQRDTKTQGKGGTRLTRLHQEITTQRIGLEN